MRVLAFLLVGVAAAPVLAQQQQADRVVIPAKTIIELEGKVIEGAVEGPDGSIIFVRQPTRFGPAIQVRKSFRVELLSSSADL